MSLADLTVFLGELSVLADGFDGEAFLDRKIAEVEARIGRARRFLRLLKQARRAPNDSP